MTGFLLRRAGALVLTVVLALAGLFALMEAAPGDPSDNFGAVVVADPEARAAIEAQRGLDASAPARFRAFLADALRGDLGTSYFDGSDVASSIGAAAPVSLELGLLALVLVVAPGAALGALAARRRGRPAELAVSVASLLAVSMPSYWLAVLALVVVGERWPELVPGAGGYVAFADDPVANLRTMVLPAIIVGLGAFALVARAVAASLGPALDEDDATFARACGLPERTVTWRIAGRRAAPGVLSVAGLAVGGLVTGAVLVESVFQLPGLGQLLVTAFTRGDLPVALGGTLVTAALLLGVNLLVDAAIVLLDPRVARSRSNLPGATS
ncbi:MAG: ABC transporter permease [Acidimicrobiales bacterium]|nr:ABC transporter permease [Acidimicrobiales bacterium]HRW36172.1 ABC transporter permease [Aquihabitans sp.]